MLAKYVNKVLLKLKKKKKATVKDLQSLCGILNFLGRVVFPGRTFTRRMYSKYAGFVNMGSHNNAVTANDLMNLSLIAKSG